MKAKIVVLTALCLLPYLSQAEDAEPQRGRLPDGTAFRTDAEGNQLFDYVAELEVNVETLERRLHGLEQELDQKNKQLAAANSNGGRAAPLVEKNLAGDKGVTQVSLPKPCPATQCPAAKDCSAEVGELQQLRESSQLEMTTLREKRAICEKRLATTDAALTQANQVLTTQASEVQLLKAKLSDATLAAARRPVEVVQVTRVEQPQTVEAPQLRPGAPRTDDDSGNRASLSMARMLAVDSVRGKMRTELNILRGLLENRNRLYSAFKTQPSAVKFSPSPARSSRGYGVDEIRKNIDRATGIYELSQARRDLSEISNTLRDDIALMERLKRVR